MNKPSNTSERAGWPVEEWAHAAGIGRSLAYVLLQRNEITSVKVGKRRIITTAPRDFLARLGAAQRPPEAA